MKLTPIAANATEIELPSGTAIFFSYQTPVAAFVPGRGVLRTDKFFSKTTTKHINGWIKNNHPSATQQTASQKEIEQLAETV